MQKAKKYDWKDSNMALFGSDTEKQVKKESAESEPAWQGCGEEIGLRIWRIVKFKVVKWEKEEYGSFYDGDSYIILNTYKKEESDEILYDVHFWIGKHSTQDEYGTAAYKTVELDTFLDDKPIQHREVQGHESELFKSYFNGITYLKGGADTGFRRVLPEQYGARLLKFQKKNGKITITELSRKRSNLCTGDVFILDLGLTVYQWNGSECNASEKYATAEELQKIRSSRSGKPKIEVLEEEDISPDHKFYDCFDQDDDDDDDDQQDEEADGVPMILKVSDEDGSMDAEEVCQGEISKDFLGTDDVYIIDTTKALFVWVGNGASIDERKNAMAYAHNHLKNTSYPWIPVSVVSEGQEDHCKEFKSSVPGCA